MLVYRITHKKYSSTLSAPGFAGRWNGPGREVIYTAESIPLAFMENMIRRKGVGFNDQFRIMIIDIPDALQIEKVNIMVLPAGWRDYKDYSKCQVIGNKWFDNGINPVLRVPSSVLPESGNYVINCQHSDFKMIKLVDTIPLIPDERIEDILKKYSG